MSLQDILAKAKSVTIDLENDLNKTALVDKARSLVEDLEAAVQKEVPVVEQQANSIASQGATEAAGDVAEVKEDLESDGTEPTPTSQNVSTTETDPSL